MPSVLSTSDMVSAFCSPASFERKDKVENSVAPPVLREDLCAGAVCQMERATSQGTKAWLHH